MSEDRDIPQLRLEQLALGELPAGERDALLARPDTAERLSRLREDDAQILAAHPPAVVVAEVRRRAARAAVRRPARALWLAAPALAAAAVAVVALWPLEEDVPKDSLVAARPPVPKDSPVPALDPGITRVKGLQPHLLLHRQEGERAVPLAEPAEARAHDRLQVSYVAGGAAHGVVLSIDGSGVVTLHAPTDPAGPTALQQDGAVTLPQSYELDAAPGFERFIFITAAEPIDVRRVEAAARALARAPDAALAALPLPPAWSQRSFLVRKVSP